MALKVPTTKELSGLNLAQLEGKLGQSAPLADRAFLRVLAAMKALADTGLYKFGIERAKQNLALTATGADLDLLGNEFSTPRKLAEFAVLSAEIVAITGTLIPATASFIGDANGVRYFLDASALAVAGVASLSMTAEVSGAAGNLQPGDSLIIVSPVAGAAVSALVTTVTTTGAEEETDSAFRPRVLFAERAVTGGSNATDHKIWAEEVAGVLRAFPFAGKPSGTSYPGDRTVYIEADPTLDPDGIAPAGLLLSVREALNIDPATGLSRPALGLVDATLYVESITRTAIDVEITNLVTPAGTDVTVKAEISAVLDSYFAGLATYVEGVDLVQERNDRITTLTLGDVVQAVLATRGASAGEIAFTIAAAPFNSYQLSAGELAKTGAVSYVTV
jgi:hypothetical protein